MKITEKETAALVALAKRDSLTPEAVVEAAKAEKHPLHRFFTWDDKKAAHAHRIDQARTLIRSVRLEIVQEDRVLSSPRFVHDPERGTKAGYTEVRSIRPESDRARDAVRSELMRSIACLRRANEVADVLGLGGEMAALIAEATAVMQRVEAGAPA
jgi:hypothetical protein